MKAMKKSVVSVVVVLWASLYLLVKTTAEIWNSVSKEMETEYIPIIRAVPLLQCILILAAGIFTAGFLGIFIIAIK